MLPFSYSILSLESSSPTLQVIALRTREEYSGESLPVFLFVEAFLLFLRLNEYLIIYRVIMNPLRGRPVT